MRQGRLTQLPGSTLLPRAALVLALLLGSTWAQADVYIYAGPDGERLVSDKPITGNASQYRLVSHRSTLANAGHILANRPLSDYAAETATATTKAALPASSKGNPDQYRRFIADASQQFKVDPVLVEAVIAVESNFNPNAVSKAGATGLMQLMTDTAARYQVKNRLNPRENIYAGVEHLSYLMRRFEGKVPLVLAAYNAGAGSVDKYSGIPPYPETRRYVMKVMDHQSRLRRASYAGR
jgi:soluble lytic murein transglycosylase-like protein